MSEEASSPPTKLPRPVITWKKSFSDWINHAWRGNYSDELVESRLLSILPFFPESDGTRTAKLINTDVGDGKYIHELFIENKNPPNEQSPKNLDVVLVHGYAASLGLFIDNFDSLSSIPGIRIHAIDLPGFGFSSRTKFPNYSNSKEDILKTEDWFIDGIEEWRKKRKINNFTLLGHSFGGYLSCAYTLKYNKNNLIDKLVLISPCGVERNRYSLLKNNPAPGADDQDVQLQNEAGIEQLPAGEQSRTGRIFQSLWNSDVSIFSFVRNAGPMKSKMMGGWTTSRFGHLYYQDPKHFQYFHDYIYRVFNGKGSGEYALTRVYAFWALARLPLLDRCPEKFVNMNLPTLWLYGDRDWMDSHAGLRMKEEINVLSQKRYNKDLASYGIISHAGHHLYLDNPTGFNKQLFNFLRAPTL
ncbi:alpha/beta-hydrolase [Suhomyces tanzawaensis NRRL Y-17324]|uniref:Alpha/beta-hydrolase n=1 Tax=Suhomyces tanzawaensis NRRL Y-17324 TaxID=984487 RepID=A0A1E4SLW0_9ASCO|nr:alpha/beta-hydrolase [Suhomyces tanzawaensis NRRL Y-17324]ODV80509.1 alpha/beta-hydrolase [Suhomyces tanzawaensis NRRL Y-17324]